MASVPTVPQVPDISVQTANPLPGEALSNLFDETAHIAQAPLPPQYTQGTSVAEPRIPTVHPYQPVAMQAPISNQATSVTHARHQNAVAGLANMIGQAGQRIQEKKQENLKLDLTQVMKAKQNIANAKAVLQQDPTNKMAQGVLQENTKQLNDILSDPKKQKQLAKALDISYTDPEKNKTPEVKAYQEAVKEFKDAGPFTADNPAEHSISLQALNPGGTNAPGSPNNQKPSAQPSPPASATPFADAALKKDLPTVENNPQYAVALKQKEEAQKQLNQYVIPQLIRAETATQIQAVKDNNAAARAEFRGAVDLTKQAAAIDAKHQDVDAGIRARLKAEAMRDSAAMSRTILSVNARLKIAEDKRLDAATANKMKAESIAQIDKDIETVANTQKSLDANLAQAKLAAKDDPQQAARVSQIEMLQEYNDTHLATLQAFRLKKATEAYGRVGETNAGSGTTINNPTRVGSANSDEDDDDSDDDSDDYGVNP